MSESALHRAVEIAGGQSKLARLIEVSQQNLWWWLHKTKRVPAEYVLPIERATHGAVTRYELRPDLYPPDESAPAPSSPQEAA
jgi:DNA-binding transcriptional regulator YdaS (Cro superfamily)